MKFLLLFLLSVVTSFSQIIRVNIGGPSYVDAGGRTWEADNYCSGSTFASVLPITNITGTSDPTLYMTGRTDPSAFSCAFSLPDGIYQVTLKFADVLPILTTPRLFNVSVQGRVVLSQFNINSLAGRGAAYDRSFNTTVLGNSPLTVLFSQVSGAPVIQAIEILYLYSVPAGDTFPSTCSIGQLFIKTNAATSQKIYVCETLNTWVQQIGSAIMTTGVGVPSGACTAGALFANTTTSPHDYYGCGPSGTWQRFVMTTDGTDGKITLQGVVSGQASISVADAAGTPNDILLPTVTGTNGYILSTNGANPQQTSWIAGGGVTSVTLVGTANQIAVTGTCVITTTGTCTFSIPSSPTFPGTVTAGGSFVAGSGSAFIAPNNGSFYWASQSSMTSPADGRIVLSNNAVTDFSRLQFGGTTSSFPALKRNGNALGIRLADDTVPAFATLTACAAGLEGAMIPVTDSSTATWGATITGGGANHVLAYCDGTAWTVMAK